MAKLSNRPAISTAGQLHPKEVKQFAIVNYVLLGSFVAGGLATIGLFVWAALHGGGLTGSEIATTLAALWAPFAALIGSALAFSLTR